MAKESKFNQNMSQLEKVLQEYLVKKAPALPTNIKDLLVQFAPYLTILNVVLSVPAVLALLGMGTLLSAVPYLGVPMAGVGLRYYLSLLFIVAIVVLDALAIPGLFAKSRKGWLFLFYATLVSAVSGLVNFNLVGMAIGTLIGLYLLFQVRSYYK